MQVVTVPAQVTRQEEVARVTGHTTDMLELLGGWCKVHPPCPALPCTALPCPALPCWVGGSGGPSSRWQGLC